MKMCWHSRRPLSTRNMKCERKCDVSCELIEQVLWIWQSYQMMMMTELSFWKTRDIEYTKNTRDSVITCHLLLTYLSNTTNSRKCIDISWKCNHLKVSCCSLLPGRVVDIVLLLFLSHFLARAASLRFHEHYKSHAPVSDRDGPRLEIFLPPAWIAIIRKLLLAAAVCLSESF